MIDSLEWHLHLQPVKERHTGSRMRLSLQFAVALQCQSSFPLQRYEMHTTSETRRGLQNVSLFSVLTLALLLYSVHNRGVSEPVHGPVPRSLSIEDQSPRIPKDIDLPVNNQTILNGHASSLDLSALFRVKRDAATDFETARCNGQAMWAKIQSAFDGHTTVSSQNYQSSNFDNGWTRNDEMIPLEERWGQYFDHELGQGKVPPAGQTSFIRLDQNKNFKNSKGETRNVSRFPKFTMKTNLQNSPNIHGQSHSTPQHPIHQDTTHTASQHSPL